jgi:hypothetical protein
MEVDPTQPQDDQGQQFVIAHFIDPSTKRPYPLVGDRTTGELRVNAEFTGEIAVALVGSSATPPDLGDNVSLQLLNDTDTGFVKLQADPTLRSIFVAIRKIMDSSNNEALVDGALDALQTVDQNPVVGYNLTDDKFKFERPTISGLDKDYSDASFTTGETGRILDFNTDRGRNGKTGTFVNDGTGTIQIEISPDGATWGDVHTIGADEEFSLDGYDIDSIRLTWVSDTGYRCTIL